MVAGAGRLAFETGRRLLCCCARDDKPHDTCNHVGVKVQALTSSEKRPSGKSAIRHDFATDTPVKVEAVVLLIDDEPVGCRG